VGSEHEVPEELQRLPGNAIVLRGGNLAPASSEKNLRAVREAYGIWGICAKAEPGRTAEEIAETSNVRSKELMPALVEDLRAKDFDVVREPGRDWPDVLITFPREPDTDLWDVLRTIMQQRGPLANPNA
jgi:hypothetical protein